MLPYIIIFILILLSFLFVEKRTSKELRLLISGIVFIFFTLFIGLRHNVGGDWGAYLMDFEAIPTRNFWNDILSSDTGYVILEYISYYLGLGIYGVNTLCAIIFLSCFFYFIKTFKIKLPYALLIAYPYLIMVVVNGYSRQGVAVGLGMVFISLLYKGKLFKSLIFFILAVSFHKSAIVLSILYLSKLKINIKSILFAIILITLIVLFYFIFQEKIQWIYTQYTKQKYSAGALIRIAINLVAGISLVVFSKQYKKLYDDYNIHFLIFIISVISFLLAATSRNITTIVDRLILYLYPFQIIIFPRIFYIIYRMDKYLGYLYFIFLILLFSGVLFVWLFFAHHRKYWIPYDNLLFYL